MITLIEQRNYRRKASCDSQLGQAIGLSGAGQRTRPGSWRWARRKRESCRRRLNRTEGHEPLGASVGGHRC